MLFTVSFLKRRWMERQHNPNHAPVYRNPPIQHFQPVQWTPPTTPERAHLATFAIIGAFMAIWCTQLCGRWKCSSKWGSLPKPPGWDSVSEFFGVKKVEIAVMEASSTPSITCGTLEIKNNFSTAALSYRTSDYPPELSLNGLYHFYASMFSHFEPLHLAINSYWTWAIAPAVMMSIGIPSTLGLYVLGGMTAIEIQCIADRAYALNQAPQLFKYIKSAQKDPNPNGTLGAQHVGSSGALFALGTVRALANKQRGWRLFALFAVSLDAVGYYMDFDTGVSYTSHLSGVLAGALFWATWLRWTKPMRMARMVGM